VLDAAHEHARSRSSFSLHTRTQPNTTFPYYHPEDESVLGLAERLPDYFTMRATSIGIGFLDSGFFPHPDLCSLPVPEGTQWERLAPARMRQTILAMQPRLLDYVDLTADGEAIGIETESLWEGDFLAWHGEMTSTIAAGNGALSDGRYRGYATEARVLPIKVGRGDGRIPEPDIKRGFDWLLAKKRWQKYGLRVLNVSIGGDFPQDWRFNEVSKAATRLHDEGVLVVAAAGNRPVEELLPPAQTPSVLTVGGVDDHNLRWSKVDEAWTVAGVRKPVDVEYSLYPHNFGTVRTYPNHNGASLAKHGNVHRKPDILAPANYLPSPLLPVHTAFRETHAIDRLRRTLRGNDSRAEELVAHWQRILRHDPNPIFGGENEMLLLDDEDESATAEWMGDVWQPLRKRMNAQKWTHAAYQHVDGTSVAAAVVSAVAAQVAQANPALGAEEIKTILCESAAMANDYPIERRGAGILQPAAAVAAALRAPGGTLVGFPRSGSLLVENELRKWGELATIGVATTSDTTNRSKTAFDRTRAVYFGLLAPNAEQVAWVSDSNDWNPDAHRLHAAGQGWWHTVVLLPQGEYHYRFYLRQDTTVSWCADPESAIRVDAGYLQPHGDHSLLIVP
jgi:serine protease AprX